jgi:hypothetical protein
MPTAMIASCVSTNDCVNCKKTDHCCSQSCREKSFLECGGAFCRLCHFPFKRVQRWPSMPMAMIACCFSTNELFTRNSMVVFVEMVYESKLLLERLLSCLCADVNNTSHDSRC